MECYIVLVADNQRDYMLRVRMSKREHKMLEHLAKLDGLNVSDAIRQLVRKEHAAKCEKGKGVTP
jgi:hypothetical protein